MKLNTNTRSTVTGECFVNSPRLGARLPVCVDEIGHIFATRDFFLERSEGDYFILLVTMSGEGKVYYSGTEYRLGTGSVILLDTRRRHRLESDSGCWESCYINLTGQAMQNYVTLCEETGCVCGVPPRQGELFSLVERCLKLMKEKKYYCDIALSADATELITKLLLSKMKKTDGGTVEKRVVAEKAIAYIGANYGNADIGVETMASHVNLSKFYFIKLFKSCTGVTPYEYLINYRISAAKERLRSGAEAVETIAHEVGFYDASGFTRCFRRSTGMTPVGYRRSSPGIGTVALSE